MAPPYRRLLFFTALIIPPAIAIDYLHRRYPRQLSSSLPQESQIRSLLRSPPNGDVCYPCLDIYTVTVPRTLFKTKDYSEEFSYHFWTNYLIRTEAFLFDSRPLPTSTSDMHEGAKIANISILESVEGPSYLFRFEIPTRLIQRFDYIADRGYPWRMLHGGFHEIVTREEGGDVRIWWICVHEYGINDGKILPWIGNWVHRLYGKAILDAAVRKLGRTYGNEG